MSARLQSPHLQSARLQQGPTLPIRDEPDAPQHLVQRAGGLATDGLAALERRALGYLQARFPLHPRGPTSPQVRATARGCKQGTSHP